MIAVEACGIGSKALLMAFAVPATCSPVIPLGFTSRSFTPGPDENEYEKIVAGNRQQMFPLAESLRHDPPR